VPSRPRGSDRKHREHRQDRGPIDDVGQVVAHAHDIGEAGAGFAERFLDVSAFSMLRKAWRACSAGSSAIVIAA
jgi:hypothetical protein